MGKLENSENLGFDLKGGLRAPALRSFVAGGESGKLEKFENSENLGFDLNGGLRASALRFFVAGGD